MYDYIRPQKILDALSYLKAKNPLYADIDINDQWVEEAMANDNELCQYLVEQDDDSMDTECQGDSSCTPNVTTSVQNECSNDGDELSTALEQLKALAKQNGFTIYNVHVPSYGDCMFSAVLYQLQANDLCSADSSESRQKVADDLEGNQPMYCDKPVPSEEDSLPLKMST